MEFVDLPLLALVLLTVCLHSLRQVPPRSAIFFYPWYANTRHDGALHRTGPRAGPAAAGRRVAVLSGARARTRAPTRGRSTRRCARSPAGSRRGGQLLVGEGLAGGHAAARGDQGRERLGLKVAAQLEPYAGRSVASAGPTSPICTELGIRDVYIYRSTDFTADDWADRDSTANGMRLFAKTQPCRQRGARGGFDRLYTYDVLVYDGALVRTDVRPGSRAAPPLRAVGRPRLRRAGRRRPTRASSLASRGGRTTRCGAPRCDAHADVVTITSYNEWSEGTQIEPAGHGGRYESYDGAYGLHGRAAERAYIDRTRYWTQLTAVRRTRPRRSRRPGPRRRPSTPRSDR